MGKSGSQRQQAHTPWGAIVLGLSAVVFVFSIIASIAFYGLLHDPSGVLAVQQYATTFITYTALAVIAATAVSIIVRYIGAALGRIRLDKNDVYFIVALLFGILTLIIGHYWR